MPLDGEWGVSKEDGSWSGLVGDVMRHKADMSVCEITVSQPRSTVIDFSYGYFYEDFRSMTKAPTTLSRPFVVLKPFSLQVSYWSKDAVSAS
jgi:hypothetical protein